MNLVVGVVASVAFAGCVVCEASEVRAPEDDAARLLDSMKPYFSPERAARVDEAIRVMKLARAAKAAMKLFDQRRSEG